MRYTKIISFIACVCLMYFSCLIALAVILELCESRANKNFFAFLLYSLRDSRTWDLVVKVCSPSYLGG